MITRQIGASDATRREAYAAANDFVEYSKRKTLLLQLKKLVTQQVRL